MVDKSWPATNCYACNVPLEGDEFCPVCRTCWRHCTDKYGHSREQKHTDNWWDKPMPKDDVEVWARELFGA